MTTFTHCSSRINIYTCYCFPIETCTHGSSPINTRAHYNPPANSCALCNFSRSSSPYPTLAVSDCVRCKTHRNTRVGSACVGSICADGICLGRLCAIYNDPSQNHPEYSFASSILPCVNYLRGTDPLGACPRCICPRYSAKRSAGAPCSSPAAIFRSDCARCNFSRKRRAAETGRWM